MSFRPPLVVVLVAATAGLLFASYATIDFAAHLDRQVHELHCSFVPGVVEADAEAEGCKVTLMSPYSSVMRRSWWGGIPISLPAMAVFAFLLFRGVDLWGRPAGARKTSASILLVGSLVPAIASVVMGYIAFSKLDAACKLCIGIYGSSGLALIGALWAKLAVGKDEPEAGQPPPPDESGKAWLFGGLQLAGFVAAPVLAYIALAPDFSKYVGSCGRLESTDDPYGVLVPLDNHSGGVPTIEVLDPLCPACKGFEERLAASGLAPNLNRKALLFPLDESCNWNVSKTLHPGACAVSEAVMCAHRQGMSTNEVLEWAFANQAAIMAAEKNQEGAAAGQVAQRFPALKGCLGSAEVRADIGKSMRWAVAHQLPVMTPQLYVDGTKLCDEDTDLGMEWALSQVLDKHKAGALPRAPASAEGIPATTKPAARAPTSPGAATPTQTKPTDPATAPKKAPTGPAGKLPSVADPKAPADAPEPAAPEPKAPEPAAPEPKAPEPKAPEPKAPEPKAPEPKAPEPKPATPAPEESP